MWLQIINVTLWSVSPMRTLISALVPNAECEMYNQLIFNCLSGFWKLRMNSVRGLAGWETLCPCQTVCTWLYERFWLSLKFQVFCVIWLITGTSVVSIQSTRLPSWVGTSHMYKKLSTYIHTYTISTYARMPYIHCTAGFLLEIYFQMVHSTIGTL